MTIQWNSNYNETMPFSDTAVQFNCGVGVAESFTVPGDPTKQYQALFEYASESNVFVRLNSVPTTPLLGTVATEPYNEFKPKKRYVKGGDIVYVITPDTNAYVGMTLRQLQS